MLIGNTNKIALNAQTVCEAIEEYFNKRLVGTTLRIMSVNYLTSNFVFTVKSADNNDNEPK